MSPWQSDPVYNLPTATDQPPQSSANAITPTSMISEEPEVVSVDEGEQKECILILRENMSHDSSQQPCPRVYRTQKLIPKMLNHHFTDNGFFLV